jgi:hypothetical protein
MKKTLLTLALAFTGFFANSQVIFSVEEPSDIVGSYDLTYAPNTDWGVPDMIDPANAILDTLMFVEDGTAGTNPQGNPISREGCSPLTNNLAGKIAVIYRNTCEFGLKAFNAQQAGAIGVVIINRDDEVVGMGAGADGINVTIPVVMVSSSTGLLLQQRLDGGQVVTAFIGNKTGYYPNDLGSNRGKMLRPRFGAMPAALAQNASELSFNTGIWIYNYGFNPASNVVVTSTVARGGTNLYTQTSSPVNIPAGDSVQIAFSTAFSQSSYPVGTYDLAYTMVSDSTDSYDFDNTVSSTFDITSDLFSVARLEAGVPAIDGGSRPSTNNSSFSTCVVFRNANASRLAARGIHFSAVKNVADGAITDEEIIITGYKWNDAFVDLNGITDVAQIFQSLEQLGSGSYFYEGDYQDSILYAPFTTPFALLDNQRYLFCSTTTNTTVFLSYDTQTKYEELEAIDAQPTQAIESDGAWSLGFVGGDVPSIGVDLMPAAELGIFENNAVEANSFPNPAVDKITVQVAGFAGDAAVTVTDLSGKVVMTKDVTVVNGQFNLNVTGLNSGMYVFNMTMADGKSSKFNVVINK